MLGNPGRVRGAAGDQGYGPPRGRATTTQYTPYHGAGILLWQDPENYIRLEIAADLRKGKIYPYANFELRQAGLLASSRGLKIKDGAATSGSSGSATRSSERPVRR